MIVLDSIVVGAITLGLMRAIWTAATRTDPCDIDPSRDGPDAPGRPR